jgi:chaperone modulatory protein CbpM
MRQEDNLPQLAIIMVDEQSQWTLADLCCACAVHADRIVELVDVGVLEPQGHKPDHWLFVGKSLPRARIAFRLQRDLEIDLNGIALALELLDEIEILREQLKKRVTVVQ